MADKKTDLIDERDTENEIDAVLLPSLQRIDRAFSTSGFDRTAASTSFYGADGKQIKLDSIPETAPIISVNLTPEGNRVVEIFDSSTKIPGKPVARQEFSYTRDGAVSTERRVLYDFRRGAEPRTISQVSVDRSTGLMTISFRAGDDEQLVELNCKTGNASRFQIKGPGKDLQCLFDGAGKMRTLTVNGRDVEGEPLRQFTRSIQDSLRALREEHGIIDDGETSQVRNRRTPEKIQQLLESLRISASDKKGSDANEGMPTSKRLRELLATAAQFSSKVDKETLSDDAAKSNLLIRDAVARDATADTRRQAIDFLESQRARLRSEDRQVPAIAELAKAQSRLEAFDQGLRIEKACVRGEDRDSNRPEAIAIRAQAAAQELDKLKQLAVGPPRNEVARNLIDVLGGKRDLDADKRHDANIEELNSLIKLLRSDRAFSERAQAVDSVRKITNSVVQAGLAETRIDSILKKLGPEAKPEDYKAVNRELREEAAANLKEGNRFGYAVALDRLRWNTASWLSSALTSLEPADPEAPIKAQNLVRFLARESDRGNRYAHEMLNRIIANGGDKEQITSLASLQAHDKPSFPNIDLEKQPEVRRAAQHVAIEQLQQEMKALPTLGKSDALALVIAAAKLASSQQSDPKLKEQVDATIQMALRSEPVILNGQSYDARLHVVSAMMQLMKDRIPGHEKFVNDYIRFGSPDQQGSEFFLTRANEGDTIAIRIVAGIADSNFQSGDKRFAAVAFDWIQQYAKSNDNREKIMNILLDASEAGNIRALETLASIGAGGVPDSIRERVFKGLASDNPDKRLAAAREFTGLASGWTQKDMSVSGAHMSAELLQAIEEAPRSAWSHKATLQAELLKSIKAPQQEVLDEKRTQLVLALAIVSGKDALTTLEKNGVKIEDKGALITDVHARKLRLIAEITTAADGNIVLQDKTGRIVKIIHPEGDISRLKYEPGKNDPAVSAEKLGTNGRVHTICQSEVVTSTAEQVDLVKAMLMSKERYDSYSSLSQETRDKLLKSAMEGFVRKIDRWSDESIKKLTDLVEPEQKQALFRQLEEFRRRNYLGSDLRTIESTRFDKQGRIVELYSGEDGKVGFQFTYASGDKTSPSSVKISGLKEITRAGDKVVIDAKARAVTVISSDGDGDGRRITHSTYYVDGRFTSTDFTANGLQIEQRSGRIDRPGSLHITESIRFRHSDQQGRPSNNQDHIAHVSAETLDTNGRVIRREEYQGLGDLADKRPFIRDNITYDTRNNTEIHTLVNLSIPDKPIEFAKSTKQINRNGISVESNFTVDGTGISQSATFDINGNLRTLRRTEETLNKDGSPAGDKKTFEYQIRLGKIEGVAVRGANREKLNLSKEKIEEALTGAAKVTHWIREHHNIEAFTVSDLILNEHREGKQPNGTLVFKRDGNLEQARVENGIILAADGKNIGTLQDSGEFGLFADGWRSGRIQNGEGIAFHGSGSDGRRLNLVSSDSTKGFTGVLVSPAGNTMHTVIGGNIYDREGKFLGRWNSQSKIPEGETDEQQTTRISNETTHDNFVQLEAGGTGEYVNSKFAHWSFHGRENDKPRLIVLDGHASTGTIFLRNADGKPEKYEIRAGMLIDPRTREQVGIFHSPQRIGSEEKLAGGAIQLIKNGLLQEPVALSDFHGAVFDLMQPADSGVVLGAMRGVVLGRAGADGRPAAGSIGLLSIEQVTTVDKAFLNSRMTAAALRLDPSSVVAIDIEKVVQGKGWQKDVPVDDSEIVRARNRDNHTKINRMLETGEIDTDDLQRCFRERSKSLELIDLALERRRLNQERATLEALPPDTKKISGKIIVPEFDSTGKATSMSEFTIKAGNLLDSKGKLAGYLEDSTGRLIMLDSKTGKPETKHMMDFRGANWHLQFKDGEELRDVCWVSLGTGRGIVSLQQLSLQGSKETEYAEHFYQKSKTNASKDAREETSQRGKRYDAYLNGIQRNGIQNITQLEYLTTSPKDLVLSKNLNVHEEDIFSKVRHIMEEIRQIKPPDLSGDKIKQTNGQMRLGNDLYVIKNGDLFLAKPKPDRHGVPELDKQGKLIGEGVAVGKLNSNYTVELAGGGTIFLSNEDRVLIELRVGSARTEYVVGLGTEKFLPGHGMMTQGGLVNTKQLLKLCDDSTSQAWNAVDKYYDDRPYLTGGAGNYFMGDVEGKMAYIARMTFRYQRDLHVATEKIIRNGFNPSEIGNRQWDAYARSTQIRLLVAKSTADDVSGIAAQASGVQKQLNEATATVLICGATAPIGGVFGAFVNAGKMSRTFAVSGRLLTSGAVGAGISSTVRASDSSNAWSNGAGGALEGLTMQGGALFTELNGLGHLKDIRRLVRETTVMTKAEQALMRTSLGRLAQLGVSTPTLYAANGALRVVDAVMVTGGLHLATAVRENDSSGLTGQSLFEGSLALLLGNIAGSYADKLANRAGLAQGGLLRGTIHSTTAGSANAAFATLPQAERAERERVAKLLGVDPTVVGSDMLDWREIARHVGEGGLHGGLIGAGSSVFGHLMNSVARPLEEHLHRAQEKQRILKHLVEVIGTSETNSTKLDAEFSKILQNASPQDQAILKTIVGKELAKENYAGARELLNLAGVYMEKCASGEMSPEQLSRVMNLPEDVRKAVVDPIVGGKLVYREMLLEASLEVADRYSKARLNQNDFQALVELGPHLRQVVDGVARAGGSRTDIIQAIERAKLLRANMDEFNPLVRGLKEWTGGWSDAASAQSRENALNALMIRISKAMNQNGMNEFPPPRIRVVENLQNRAEYDPSSAEIRLRAQDVLSAKNPGDLIEIFSHEAVHHYQTSFSAKIIILDEMGKMPSAPDAQAHYLKKAQQRYGELSGYELEFHTLQKILSSKSEPVASREDLVKALEIAKSKRIWADMSQEVRRNADALETIRQLSSSIRDGNSDQITTLLKDPLAKGLIDQSSTPIKELIDKINRDPESLSPEETKSLRGYLKQQFDSEVVIQKDLRLRYMSLPHEARAHEVGHRIRRELGLAENRGAQADSPHEVGVRAREGAPVVEPEALSFDPVSRNRLAPIEGQLRQIDRVLDRAPSAKREPLKSAMRELLKDIPPDKFEAYADKLVKLSNQANFADRMQLIKDILDRSAPKIEGQKLAVTQHPIELLIDETVKIETIQVYNNLTRTTAHLSADVRAAFGLDAMLRSNNVKELSADFPKAAKYERAYPRVISGTQLAEIGNLGKEYRQAFLDTLIDRPGLTRAAVKSAIETAQIFKKLIDGKQIHSGTLTFEFRPGIDSLVREIGPKVLGKSVPIEELQERLLQRVENLEEFVGKDTARHAKLTLLNDLRALDPQVYKALIDPLLSRKFDRPALDRVLERAGSYEKLLKDQPSTASDLLKLDPAVRSAFIDPLMVPAANEAVLKDLNSMIKSSADGGKALAESWRALTPAERDGANGLLQRLKSGKVSADQLSAIAQSPVPLRESLSKLFGKDLKKPGVLVDSGSEVVRDLVKALLVSGETTSAGQAQVIEQYARDIASKTPGPSKQQWVAVAEAVAKGDAHAERIVKAALSHGQDLMKTAMSLTPSEFGKVRSHEAMAKILDTALQSDGSYKQFQALGNKSAENQFARGLLKYLTENGLPPKDSALRPQMVEKWTSVMKELATSGSLDSAIQGYLHLLSQVDAKDLAQASSETIRGLVHNFQRGAADMPAEERVIVLQKLLETTTRAQDSAVRADLASAIARQTTIADLKEFNRTQHEQFKKVATEHLEGLEQKTRVAGERKTTEFINEIVNRLFPEGIDRASADKLFGGLRPQQRAKLLEGRDLYLSQCGMREVFAHATDEIQDAIRIEKADGFAGSFHNKLVRRVTAVCTTEEGRALAYVFRKATGIEVDIKTPSEIVEGEKAVLFEKSSNIKGDENNSLISLRHQKRLIEPVHFKEFSAGLNMFDMAVSNVNPEHIRGRIRELLKLKPDESIPQNGKIDDAEFAKINRAVQQAREDGLSRALAHFSKHSDAARALSRAVNAMRVVNNMDFAEGMQQVHQKLVPGHKPGTPLPEHVIFVDISRNKSGAVDLADSSHLAIHMYRLANGLSASAYDKHFVSKAEAAVLMKTAATKGKRLEVMAVNDCSGSGGEMSIIVGELAKLRPAGSNISIKVGVVLGSEEGIAKISIGKPKADEPHRKITLSDKIEVVSGFAPLKDFVKLVERTLPGNSVEFVASLEKLAYKAGGVRPTGFTFEYMFPNTTSTPLTELLDAMGIRGAASGSRVETFPKTEGPPFSKKEARTDMRNFSQVDEHLLRGGNIGSEDALQVIKDRGVKLIIDMTNEGNSIERSNAEKYGLKYVHMRVDASGNNPEQLTNVLKAINAEQGKVFVHCTNGTDRTGAIVAIYRQLKNGWNDQHALHEMHAFGWRGETPANARFGQYAVNPKELR